MKTKQSHTVGTFLKYCGKIVETKAICKTLVHTWLGQIDSYIDWLLLTLTEHLWVLVWVHVALSLVFRRSLFVLLCFSFGHCVV